jgi:hypothetical protein
MKPITFDSHSMSMLCQSPLARLRRFCTIAMSVMVRATASCSAVTLETPMCQIFPSLRRALSAPIDSA